jgi:hypothetical protein
MEIPRDPNVAIIVPANGLPRDDSLCRGECLVWWTEYKSVTEQINNLPSTTKLFYLELRPDDHEDVIGWIARNARCDYEHAFPNMKHTPMTQHMTAFLQLLSRFTCYTGEGSAIREWIRKTPDGPHSIG